MELPQLLQRQAIKSLDRFCAEAAAHPLHPRQLFYRIEGRQLHLFEVQCPGCQPDKQQERPIAQLRYQPELNQWTLHHQNGQHWQLYLNINPSLDLGKQLIAIKQDPLGCFWSS
jgi:hypothetical protein